MDTYFTFADGSLRYDCPSCRQRCCHGKGIGLAGAELVPLVARVPSLASHLRLGAGGTLHATNLADGCWFLDGAGMCKVELEHGRAAKPGTCRLFPFNRVFRVADVRVVDVNSVLCPVEEAHGEGVRHAELAREIDELAGSPLVDAPAQLPPELDAGWLAIERRASQLAEEHARDAAALARAMGVVRDAAPSWARLHGLGDGELAALEREVAPRVARLAPSLRWNTLFRKDAAPYPRAVARLPSRLRALSFLGALATRTAGRAPSLRGLSELWQSQAGTLDVLARWDEPVQLGAPRFDADLPEALAGVLGALLAGAFRGGKTLGQLVEGAAAGVGESLRPLVVAVAASQMDTLLPG